MFLKSYPPKLYCHSCSKRENKQIALSQVLIGIDTFFFFCKFALHFSGSDFQECYSDERSALQHLCGSISIVDTRTLLSVHIGLNHNARFLLPMETR